MAGARRKNHRKVPSAIARTAARWDDASKARSASSEERPSNTTAETALAASASAAAPGAQRDLSAKSTPRQIESVDEIPSRDRPTPGSLQLCQGEPTPPTGNDNGS